MNSMYIENLGKDICFENITRVAAYKEDDVIYISGSVIEGIGNKRSDLDVFVLSKDLQQIDSSEIVYDFNKFKSQFILSDNGINCVIEYRPMDVLESIIEQVNRITLEDDTVRTLNEVKVQGYNLLELASIAHRFIVGIPIYNKEKYDKLRAEFDLKKFCRLMVRHYINSADNSYEDVLGNLEGNRPETALLASRNMLYDIMQGYIFSWGTTIDRSKWICEKLRILSEKNEEAQRVYDKFQRLFFYTHLKDRQDLTSHVEEILSYTNEIISLIEERLGGV
jgi:predicted nucleotidyltransferase